MKLFIVRHGEAQSIEVDPECSLSSKGKADVTNVAQYLGKHGLRVSHLLHSTKRRAAQTAEILSEALSIPDVTATDTLLAPQADVEPIAEMIRSWTDDTMLVSHLPLVSRLVSQLVIGDADYFPIVNFPPGTVVCLDQYEGQRWIISWLLRPSIVPTCE